MLHTRVAAGDLPDVAIVPRPGVYTDFANQGLIKSLDDLGVTGFKDSYQPAWVDLGSVDGVPYAITVKANSKSMIWDRPADLAAAGGAPATLDDFKTLLDQDGRRAARSRWSSRAKDSWTLTDWFENIYYPNGRPGEVRRPVRRQAALHRRVGHGCADHHGQADRAATSGSMVAARLPSAPAYQDGLARCSGRARSAEFFMEGGFTGAVASPS